MHGTHFFNFKRKNMMKNGAPHKEIPISSATCRISEMAKELPLIMADPHWVDGIPYPGFIKEEVIRKIPDIPVYNNDIFITGYPKSGKATLHNPAQP